MFKNNFPVTVKIRTSGYQTLECFIATLPTWGVYGRLVHVGEHFNRLILQILGCELHKNAFGGRALPGPAGGAIALPNPLAVIRVRGRREGKEKFGNRRGERGKGRT